MELRTAGVACGRRFQLLDRSSESFGRFADYESPGCKADMAEGSAEEEQSSTAAPASPPADLRTLNTQLSPPYHYQSHLVPPLQHLQHPNMLATAVPPRHSHSMLSHQGKTDAELDAPCDVPLNLKSEPTKGNNSILEEERGGKPQTRVSKTAVSSVGPRWSLFIHYTIIPSANIQDPSVDTPRMDLMPGSARCLRKGACNLRAKELGCVS
ncbi:hypothetical protein WN48_08195 [Eufriesea mexicana]|nr:hypothetical protein WN48_08195 [Eufriesea mexicana]